MASNESDQLSVAALLASEDEEREGMRLCTKCGRQNADTVRICECGERTSWPTLGECGKQLPIGIEQGNRLIKSFDMIPLSWKIERDIGREWEGRRNQISISDYIGTILAYTVTMIGDTEIRKHKIPKRLLIFNQMYSADVFYMYAYLRFISIGKDLRIQDNTCPFCGHTWEFIADLSTIEVVVASEPNKLSRKIKLRDGFQMGGDLRSEISVKPTKWNMLGGNFPSNASDAAMFAAMLTNAVDGITGLPPGAVITENEIEQLSKYDMELIEYELDQVLCGPRWTIEGKCPKCNRDFSHILNWGFESFFSISSRSLRSRSLSRV